jgi:FkbM family methyltransferase
VANRKIARPARLGTANNDMPWRRSDIVEKGDGNHNAHPGGSWLLRGISDIIQPKQEGITVGIGIAVKKAAFKAFPGIVTGVGAAVSETRGSEIALVRALLSANQAAIDIGASWGAFTYVLAQGASRVEAFEPNPEKIAYLRALAWPRCTIHGVALSDHAGQAELVIPTGEPACATIEPEHPLAHSTASGLVHAKVDLRSLDDFGFSNVGFLKIDVEGHELAVLRGGRKLLERDRPVMFIEIERRHNRPAFEQTFAFLKELGYQTYSVSHRHLASLEYFDAERDQSEIDIDGGTARGTYIYNFLFVPTGDDTTLAKLRRESFDIKA